MSKWSDFFGMSRRERRGTLVILALMTLVMAGAIIMRQCAPRRQVAIPEADIEQFEQAIDSMRQTPTSSKPPKAHPKTRKRHHRREPKKTPPQPRRLDPVPQIDKHFALWEIF